MCVCVCRREWNRVLLTFDTSTCRDIVSSETHNHCPRTAGCDITGRPLLLSPWLHFQNGRSRGSIIDNFCLDLTETVSRQSCDPHFCSLSWGYSWCKPLKACLGLLMVLNGNIHFNYTSLWLDSPKHWNTLCQDLSLMVYWIIASYSFCFLKMQHVLDTTRHAHPCDVKFLLCNICITDLFCIINMLECVPLHASDQLFSPVL